MSTSATRACRSAACRRRRSSPSPYSLRTRRPPGRSYRTTMPPSSRRSRSSDPSALTAWTMQLVNCRCVQDSEFERYLRLVRCLLKSILTLALIVRQAPLSPPELGSRLWGTSSPTAPPGLPSKVTSYSSNIIQFICTQCGKAFNSHGDLAKHQERNHGPDAVDPEFRVSRR